MYGSRRQVGEHDVATLTSRIGSENLEQVSLFRIGRVPVAPGHERAGAQSMQSPLSQGELELRLLYATREKFLTHEDLRSKVIDVHDPMVVADSRPSASACAICGCSPTSARLGGTDATGETTSTRRNRARWQENRGRIRRE